MKKIVLITTAVITFAAFFAGCQNPAGNSSVPSSSKPSQSATPQGGGSSTPAQITVTVAGDKHVTLKAEKTFTADKGKKWHRLKAQAEGKIDHYEENYGLDKWTLTDAAGQDLTNDYTFNANTTVFIVTKRTSAPPPAQITITVAGDEHAVPKADHTLRQHYFLTKSKVSLAIISLIRTQPSMPNRNRLQLRLPHK